jgi:mannose-6-phosphate isomerase-like protein (cupin superfamily)
MTLRWIGLLLMLPLVGAEPAGYKYWSAADLKIRGTRLSNNTNEKTSIENLGRFGADYAELVHRNVSGLAELHATKEDLLVIVAGRGELVIGGTMVGSKRTTVGEVRGSSIDGGVHQELSPGDIVHIPPKTPHQILLNPGVQISYFVLKIRK